MSFREAGSKYEFNVVHSTGYTRDHAASEHRRSRWVRVGTSLALPFGFTLRTGILVQRIYYEGAGGVHLTLDGHPLVHPVGTEPRLDAVRLQSAAGAHSRRALTNAQAQEYECNRAELRFVRQF